MAAGVEGRCPLKPEKVRQHRRLLTALSPPGRHRPAQNETPRAMSLRAWSVTRHHGGDRAAPIGQPIDDFDTSWEAGPCLWVPANDFLRCPSTVAAACPSTEGEWRACSRLPQSVRSVLCRDPLECSTEIGD